MADRSEIIETNWWACAKCRTKIGIGTSCCFSFDRNFENSKENVVI